MKFDRVTLSLAIAALAMIAMIACHDGSEKTGLEVQLVPIPNATVPMPGVVSGGQPTEAQIESAAERGYRTVINLRTDQEAGFDWERGLVESSGMRYVHIPVAGADGLTRENVELLHAALAEARDEGPVLLHCGSGNRIGALLALRAAWIEGSDPHTALQYGLGTGLTGLEPKTRELLGLAPE
jgi:uncharacterized protein (TIGR01244 family)